MKSSKDTGKKDPKKSDKKVTDTSRKYSTTTKAGTASKTGMTLKTTTTASKKDIKGKTGTGTARPPSKMSTTSTATTRPTTARTNDPRRGSRIAITPMSKGNEDPQTKLKRIRALIDKKKLLSGVTTVIEKRFNQWKMLTMLQKQQIQEKSVKTIVTKKRLNIHRIAPKKPEPMPNAPGSALHKTYTTIEGGPQTNLNLITIEEEQKRKERLKRLIESRIGGLETNIDILRRFFERWIGKRKEEITMARKSSVVTKKKIILIKERSKNILESSAKEGADDGLKKIATLPVSEPISLTGTKTLTEKIVQRASRKIKTRK